MSRIDTIFYVYVWKNQVNTMAYVGMGRNDRCLQHIEGDASPLLKAAMRDFGIHNFTMTIVKMRMTKAEARSLEAQLIAACGSMQPNGYNKKA